MNHSRPARTNDEKTERRADDDGQHACVQDAPRPLLIIVKLLRWQARHVRVHQVQRKPPQRALDCGLPLTRARTNVQH